MARRRGKRGRDKRGTTHSVSILTTLFAVTPALYVLSAVPPGGSQSPLAAIMSAQSNGWVGIQNAAWAIASNVISNWVSILIVLAVAFIGISVVRRLGRGTWITKRLRI